MSAIAATTALTVAGSALFLSAQAKDAGQDFQLPANEVVLSGVGNGSGPGAPSPGFAAAVQTGGTRQRGVPAAPSELTPVDVAGRAVRLADPISEAFVPAGLRLRDRDERGHRSVYEARQSPTTPCSTRTA